jgi:uncharacterized protein YjiS (DUF1127 family)
MEMIMSTITSAPVAARHMAAGPAGRRLVPPFKRWWMAYMTWRAEQAAVATLSALSDRQLKDIGLTRSGIVGAVREATRGAQMWS